MGKILSIAIPSYNSQDYLARALDSVVEADADLEVIVVDDGSTDGTKDIALEYVKRYPDIVRYHYKENGGHGDAVMAGLKLATGLYFKVLDSDDWLNTKALKKITAYLREQAQGGHMLDMIVANYVYDKVGDIRKKVVRYVDVLPVEQEFGWKDIGRFRTGQYILMHSVIYSTALLKSCGLVLPKKTFYVDNLFVYYPLPYVKSIVYFDYMLYHYYLGRDDQSVNQTKLLERIDQQVRVADLMYGMHRLAHIEEPKLRQYMAQYNIIMASICSALYVVKGTEEAAESREAFWQMVKVKYPDTYRAINKNWLGRAIQWKGPVGNFLVRIGYRVAQTIFRFN